MSGWYNSPEYYETVDAEIASINEMKEGAQEVEATIETLIAQNRGALWEIDDPEGMDARRSQGHAYSDTAERLDGLYRQLGSIEEAILERERNLGYL